MDLDDLDFLSDYLKNRDKIILSEVENDDDDTNQEAPKRSTSRKRATITEIKTEDESNVSKCVFIFSPQIDFPFIGFQLNMKIISFSRNQNVLPRNEKLSAWNWIQMMIVS